MAANGERRRRPGRWLRRGVLALAVLEVLYLVAGNAFLRTGWGPGVLNRKPEKLSVSWRSAWTALPGLVHVERLALGGAGRRVAWHTEIDRADVWFWLPALLVRHVHVLRGVATGATVDLDLLPKSETTGRRGRPGWAVTLGGLDVDGLHRIRLDEDELVGAGELAGWARFQVRGPLELRLARLAFTDAVVRSNDAEVARRIDLRSSLDLAPFRIGEDDLAHLLTGTRATIDLKAATDHLGFLSAYLRRVPWLRLDGHGDLGLDVRVEAGALRPGSTMTLTGPDVEAHFFGLTAHGRGTVKGGVDGDGVHLGAVLAEFAVARAGNGATPLVSGHGLEVRVTSASTSLNEPPRGLAGRLVLPGAKVHDLAAFDPYLPPGLQIRLDGGTADLSADLTYDTVGGSGSGRLTLTATDVHGAFGDAAFTTGLTLHLASPDLDLLAGRFDVSGSRLTVTSAQIRRGGELKAQNWSARVSLPKGQVTVPPPGRKAPAVASRALALATGVEAEMDSTAPVVVLLEQRVPRLAWLDRLLTIRDVHLTSTVDAEGKTLGLRSLQVTGGAEDQLEILGDLDLDGADTHGVTYVRYRRLAAALALDGGDRRWSLVRPRRKYDEALAAYRAKSGAGEP